MFKGAELVVRIQGAPSSSFYYVYFLSDYRETYDAVRPSLSVAATIVCILTRFLFGVRRVHEPVQCAAGGHCEGMPLSHLRMF